MAILRGVNRISGADKILNGTMQLKPNSISAHPCPSARAKQKRRRAIMTESLALVNLLAERFQFLGSAQISVQPELDPEERRSRW